MSIKINGRPIRIRDKRETTMSKQLMLTYILTGIFTFVLLDHVGFIFAGIHPFPLMRFVEGVLNWFIR